MSASFAITVIDLAFRSSGQSVTHPLKWHALVLHNAPLRSRAASTVPPLRWRRHRPRYLHAAATSENDRRHRHPAWTRAKRKARHGHWPVTTSPKCHLHSQNRSSIATRVSEDTVTVAARPTHGILSSQQQSRRLQEERYTAAANVLPLPMIKESNASIILPPRLPPEIIVSRSRPCHHRRRRCHRRHRRQRCRHRLRLRRHHRRCRPM